MTPRFTDDDERGFIVLPIGKYPARVTKESISEKPDGEGNIFYKVEFKLVSGDYKGTPLFWNVSEFWMKHLLIHFMRAIGMMKDMIVAPFFRSDPTDSASFDMERIVGNMMGCFVLIETGLKQYQGKTQHEIKDFHPLRRGDQTPVDQPQWIEIVSTAQSVPQHSQQAQGAADGQPAGDGSNGVDLDPDMDLEEDEDFFVD